MPEEIIADIAAVVNVNDPWYVWDVLSTVTNIDVCDKQLLSETI